MYDGSPEPSKLSRKAGNQVFLRIVAWLAIELARHFFPSFKRSADWHRQCIPARSVNDLIT
jgi:hypothetical protein